MLTNQNDVIRIREIVNTIVSSGVDGIDLFKDVGFMYDKKLIVETLSMYGIKFGTIPSNYLDKSIISITGCGHNKVEIVDVCLFDESGNSTDIFLEIEIYLGSYPRYIVKGHNEL